MDKEQRLVVERDLERWRRLIAEDEETGNTSGAEAQRAWAYGAHVILISMGELELAERFYEVSKPGVDHG